MHAFLHNKKKKGQKFNFVEEISGCWNAICKSDRSLAAFLGVFAPAYHWRKKCLWIRCKAEGHYSLKVAAKSDAIFCSGLIYVDLTPRSAIELDVLPRFVFSDAFAVFHFTAEESLNVRYTASSAAKTEFYPILSISLPSARFTLFKAETFKPRHVASW